jgi:hypothetical protein
MDNDAAGLVLFVHEKLDTKNGIAINPTIDNNLGLLKNIKINFNTKGSIWCLVVLNFMELNLSPMGVKGL